MKHMLRSKGFYPIKKIFVFAILMASITSFSKSLIPINVKGVLGVKIKNNDNFSQVFATSGENNKVEAKIDAEVDGGIDLEVEARAYDINFTDLISMENNIGVSVGFSTNLINGIAKNLSIIYLETLAYYQPAVKFKLLNDLSLKVGTKFGVGSILDLFFNSGNRYQGTFPAFVSSFVAGIEYKNIITETELGSTIRIYTAPDNGLVTANVLPSFKIKAGYRF